MAQKNGGGGPTWVVKQEKLFEALDLEQNTLEKMLTEKLPKELTRLLNESGQDIVIPDDALPLIRGQLEPITTSARIWLNLYHSLVLLHAAMDPPSRKGINDPEPENGSSPATKGPCGGYTHCLDNSHATPAWHWTNEEDSTDGEDNWFGYKPSEASLVKKLEEYLSQTELSSYAQNLPEELPTAIAQHAKIGGEDLLLLPHFLDKTKNLFPAYDPNSFKPIKCLQTCLKSASQIKPTETNEYKTIYIEDTIYKIAMLWGEDFKRDFIDNLKNDDINGNLSLWAKNVTTRLKEVEGSWEVIGMDKNAFVKWFRINQPSLVQLQLPEDLLIPATNADNETLKWALAGIVAMLNFNTITLKHIEHRCFSLSDSLPHTSLFRTINALAREISDENAKQWFYLEFATFRIVAWHIFHQISPTFK